MGTFNNNKDKSPKSNITIPPKRNVDGKWPEDLTPQQVGMMTTQDATEYMAQLMLDTLNRATSKLKENNS
jgi:hypothetical protein